MAVSQMQSEIVNAAERDGVAVHVEGLWRSFGPRAVLQDLDLDIRAGEFVSILGPSGCGKSTLLGLIGGLSIPSNGTIDWPQSTYDAHGHPERSIGIVFQEPTLLPWRTVFENVYLPLQLIGVSRSEARDQVVAQLVLDGARDACRGEDGFAECSEGGGQCLGRHGSSIDVWRARRVRGVSAR